MPVKLKKTTLGSRSGKITKNSPPLKCKCKINDVGRSAFFKVQIQLNLVADINQLKRTERLVSRLVTSIRHLPCEERLQRLGLHSLQLQRLRADLITAFKLFTGLLDVDSNLFCLPPTRFGTPTRYFKLRTTADVEISAFSVRVVKYRI